MRESRDRRPSNSGSLASFLPEPGRPQAITDALATVEARRADVARAEAEVATAVARVESARVEDRQQYALARDRGEDDPGPVREREAEALLADARRRLEGEQLRYTTAEQRLDAALVEDAAVWLENLERAHARADRDSLAALDKVEASEARRADVRAALQWVTTYASTGERPPRAFAGAVPSDVRKDPNDPATYSSTELLRALRGALERSTLSARPELLRALRGALEGLTLGARQE